MAKKKLTSVSNGGKVATVYRDPEWNEFVVKLKGRPAADYFTSDRKDAEATAKKMVGLAGLGTIYRQGVTRARFSCSKSSAIIRQIVGRLHVSTSDSEVGAYAVSRLKKGASPALRKAVAACAVKEHHRNQKLYNDVMGGRIR